VKLTTHLCLVSRIRMSLAACFITCVGTVLLYISTIIMPSTINVVVEPLHETVGNVNSATSLETKSSLTCGEQVHS
jgi:hypothetical protein